jgi:NodT family efflux transporter outer membrane factor (OMF) lipoprotein
MARLVLTGIAVAVLAACTHLSDEASHATAWDAKALGLDSKTSSAALPDTRWWLAYGDTQLDGLIEQALANNPTMHAVQARLARAQAASDAASGADSPQVGAGMDLTRQRMSANYIYPPPLGGAIINTGTLQASASWELDLFGKNRSALEATIGQVRAAQADAQAARVLLAANVARSYFALARIQGQIDIAQRALEQRKQIKELVQERFTAGLDTRVELTQSQGNMPDAQLQIEILNEQRGLTQNALAALVATPNRALAVEIPALAAIKTIASADTIPADLLGRRADIVAARWRIEAAGQEVKSAKALFYPNVNLVAFTGFASIGFDKLVQNGSDQWGVGPAIRLPLFESGRLRANLRGKAAERDAAIDAYNTLVLDAMRDVSDQLVSVQSIARQQVEQKATQAAAEANVNMAQQRFQAGLTTRLQVLTAQANVLQQQRVAVDLAARALDVQVQLVRALGGGFGSTETSSPVASLITR